LQLTQDFVASVARNIEIRVCLCLSWLRNILSHFRKMQP
jgi:hypothetical protein